MQREVLIDEEIRSPIPGLANGEFAELKASMLQEGCREPLVIWKGHDILLDGHPRGSLLSNSSLRTPKPAAED